jgi:hypothetical protein
VLQSLLLACSVSTNIQWALPPKLHTYKSSYPESIFPFSNSRSYNVFRHRFAIGTLNPLAISKSSLSIISMTFSAVGFLFLIAGASSENSLSTSSFILSNSASIFLPKSVPKKSALIPSHSKFTIDRETYPKVQNSIHWPSYQFHSIDAPSGNSATSPQSQGAHP